MDLEPAEKVNTIEKNSQLARRILEKDEGGPHLLCNWTNCVFIHYEVDAESLQPEIPYTLHLYNNKAYVSLVAFTLEKFRFSKWEQVTQWFTKPIATHQYFNVRSYVQHRNENGIYFIKEWISNFFCAFIGSRMYELPCHRGSLNYQYDHSSGQLTGSIIPGNIFGQYQYEMRIPKEARFGTIKDPFDEFLLERYVAFVQGKRKGRYFRIWHKPWLQTRIDINRLQDDLMGKIGPWGNRIKCIGAHYSPGVFDVWMGRPQRI